MFADQRITSFYFDYKTILNKQIGVIISDDSSVLIEDFQRVLLFDAYSKFTQSMCKSVLVDLFEMAVPVKFVNSKTGFSNNIAQFEDSIFFPAVI